MHKITTSQMKINIVEKLAQTTDSFIKELQYVEYASCLNFVFLSIQQQKSNKECFETPYSNYICIIEISALIY